jgi:hypothetical protein
MRRDLQASEQMREAGVPGVRACPSASARGC